MKKKIMQLGYGMLLTAVWLTSVVIVSKFDKQSISDIDPMYGVNVAKRVYGEVVEVTSDNKTNHFVAIVNIDGEDRRVEGSRREAYVGDRIRLTYNDSTLSNYYIDYIESQSH